MKLLFGEDLSTADGDGELAFSEYLSAVGMKNRKQFASGAAGTSAPEDAAHSKRIAAASPGGRQRQNRK